MNELMLKVLEQIRDEARVTREQLTSRIDATNNRLESLERRQTETEIRLSTELIAVVGAVNALKDTLLEDRKLRGQVADHETRLRVLEEKRAG